MECTVSEDFDFCFRSRQNIQSCYRIYMRYICLLRLYPHSVQIVIVEYHLQCNNQLFYVDYIIGKAQEAASGSEKETVNFYYGSYLFLSVTAFTAGLVGIVYLYLDYAGCSLGQFFISFTLILSIIAMVVSVLEKVNKGILTPCVMFAYAAFLCWYALLSSPDGSCNPTAYFISGGRTVSNTACDNFRYTCIYSTSW